MFKSEYWEAGAHLSNTVSAGAAAEPRGWRLCKQTLTEGPEKYSKY